jgi:hypothetical protein
MLLCFALFEDRKVRWRVYYSPKYPHLRSMCFVTFPHHPIGGQGERGYQIIIDQEIDDYMIRGGVGTVFDSAV